MSSEFSSEGFSPPSFQAYAEEEIDKRIAMTLSFIPSIKEGDQPDSLRLMRVWARRSRAAIECCKGCFPEKEIGRIEEELKSVATALGETRDLDVLLMALDRRNLTLPEVQQPGIAEMIANLRLQRVGWQEKLIKSIRKLERMDLLGRFRRLRETSPPITSVESNHPKETPPNV